MLLQLRHFIKHGVCEKQTQVLHNDALHRGALDKATTVYRIEIERKRRETVPLLDKKWRRQRKGVGFRFEVRKMVLRGIGFGA